MRLQRIIPVFSKANAQVSYFVLHSFFDFTPWTYQNLLAWLMKQKEKGYFIVGVEQTSSSLPLTEMVFPRDQPTVLLLGKEKEGIPVEFLSAVDQCVEIPQLGIIRSLNVHVSGAITIWEYTKQQLENGK